MVWFTVVSPNPFGHDIVLMSMSLYPWYCAPVTVPLSMILCSCHYPFIHDIVLLSLSLYPWYCAPVTIPLSMILCSCHCLFIYEDFLQLSCRKSANAAAGRWSAITTLTGTYVIQRSYLTCQENHCISGEWHSVFCKSTRKQSHSGIISGGGPRGAYIGNRTWAGAK